MSIDVLKFIEALLKFIKKIFTGLNAVHKLATLFVDPTLKNNSDLNQNQSNLIWYTDAIKGNSGEGVYSASPSTFSISVREYSTIFQAKVSAILVCAN